MKVICDISDVPESLQMDIRFHQVWIDGQSCDVCFLNDAAILFIDEKPYATVRPKARSGEDWTPEEIKKAARLCVGEWRRTC